MFGIQQNSIQFENVQNSTELSRPSSYILNKIQQNFIPVFRPSRYLTRFISICNSPVTVFIYTKHSTRNPRKIKAVLAVMTIERCLLRQKWRLPSLFWIHATYLTQHCIRSTTVDINCGQMRRKQRPRRDSGMHAAFPCVDDDINNAKYERL